VDPEFTRAVIFVAIAGTLIFGAGALALYFVFRRFEGKKAGGPTHMALIFGLIGFVLLSCLALFGLSYAGR
jgi:hypothetical protein